MSRKGTIKKMTGAEVQVVEGNRLYKKFNNNRLPDGVLTALNNAAGSIAVEFHTNQQGQLAQGQDNKYLIWLPGDPEPAMPEPRPITPQINTPIPYPLKQHVHVSSKKEKIVMPSKVTHVDEIQEHGKIKTLLIHFEPKMLIKDDLTDVQEHTRFQVTDPALAFQENTQITQPDDGENPGLAVKHFSPNLPGIGGAEPDIDRNPYNFVSLPGGTPWNYPSPHPDHAAWLLNHHTGFLEYTAKAITPLFVPEGFPFSPTNDAKVNESLRTTPRRFCRMTNAKDEIRYVVPGVSVKGMVRSEIEALSNSRMGVLNSDYYQRRIPYRRRCYNISTKKGVIIHVGVVINKPPIGDADVTKVIEGYIRSTSSMPASGGQWKIIAKRPIAAADPGGPYNNNKQIDYKAGLLCRSIEKPYQYKIFHYDTATIKLPKKVIELYETNLKHDHYQKHHNDYMAKRAKEKTKPIYKEAEKGIATPKLEKCIEDLKLKKGDIIYFTVNDNKTEITSFGKNVNYLWPAEHSIKQLINGYLLPEDLGLLKTLSMAERMFGFAADHKKQNGLTVSHPFRSRLRFETLWGPEVDPNEANWPDKPEGNNQGFKVKLAPLTSPQARAKARPLYLEPRQSDGLSASYSDTDPKMRGRKFYWHQKAEDADGIWSIHKRHKYHDLIEKQLPPEISPLKTGTGFTGRIHFDNLTGEELGALIYSLSGDGSYEHGVKLGKGKPRGLGSISIKIEKLSLLKPEKRYESLTTPTAGYDEYTGYVLKQELKTRITDFKTWCRGRHNNQPFDDQDHIKDYKELHTLPQAFSARYYPLNFRQYSWLPEENKHPDEPKLPAKRPKAMKRAREIPA
ncbi:MAG: TIGR03986 family CRISPR-associated RAMP protein [Deltaproteobacteria bacterium]|nr:TIGR03986 family CRISPR-associated RAMP protein [Deltaproteobacteria bacterium]